MMERFVTVSMAVLLLTVLLAACGPAPASVEETRVVPSADEQIPPSPSAPAEPVILDNYSTSDIPTLDPQLAYDVASVNYIENLFVNLTGLDPEGLELLPEAATGWQGREDGLAYTFTLRTDIPWIQHDPETGETRQVLDERGNPRFVTAHDFAYAIKRACDPNVGSYYSSVVAPVIKGCEAVLYFEDPAAVPPELVEAIGVSAPADDTLVIELEFPASYFLSMTPMWTLAATPEWVIEEHGEAWIEPGNLVTNGRYVLHEWQPGGQRSLWRNPLMPQDLRGTGNIERVVTRIVPELSTGYALWLKNEVDATGIPDLELETHLEEFPEETSQVPDLSVSYFGFALDKPPFDNVHVRRAFSAAFDRQTFADQVVQGQCLPMVHFAPPGIFGAPPIDEVGVGFDPAYAREQLAEAGYPDCEGFPQVTLLTFEGQDSLHDAEYAQAQWEEHLGCSPEMIQIEQLPFNELLEAVRAPAETRPHMWDAGWAPDYPDENNWVGDVLWCKNQENPRRRECSAVDELIVEAREEPVPEQRIALYRQIEEGFFGPEGEMPIAPLCTWVGFGAVHGWLDPGPLELFSGVQWYNWTIDWEAKKAAQGR